MKTTDFAQCLASYLTMYLPGQLGLSENTIMAYRDTFKLVLLYESSICCPWKRVFVLSWATWHNRMLYFLGVGSSLSS